MRELEECRREIESYKKIQKRGHVESESHMCLTELEEALEMEGERRLRRRS